METNQRLTAFVALLEKWNPAINLVARGSMDGVWTRHVQDSLQIVPLRGPGSLSWLDLGSGAGLPGMVVAIALAEVAPQIRVTLVEADMRKAEFLRTVSRETEVPVAVLPNRIESVSPQRADIVSARALAPLSRLCGYAARHLAPDGRAIFLKGAQAEAEIAEARRDWSFHIDRHASQTERDANILVLSDLRHV